MPLKSSLNLLVGLRSEFLQAPNKVLKGIVHPFVNQAANFDTLNYHYNMQNYLFLGNMQLDWNLHYHGFLPYISMGLGTVLNRLSDYTETTPQGSSAATMVTHFRSHTRAQFA